MKKIFLLLIFTVSFNLLFGQDTSKIKKIKELIHLTESDKLGQQIVNSLFVMYKNKYKTIAQDQWDDLKKEITVDKFIDMLVRIYDKFYTENEIEQLKDFYNSPIGKKVIKSTPSIMKESILEGQSWGKEIATQIDNMLKDRKLITQS